MEDAKKFVDSHKIGNWEKGNSIRTTQSGACYVATAVYGSYDCPEVWVLRRFRDCNLAKSPAGRAFIRFYYATSPALVQICGETSGFKKIVKPILNKNMIDG